MLRRIKQQDIKALCRDKFTQAFLLYLSMSGEIDARVVVTMIKYDKFRLSLKRLEDQNQNYRQKKPAVLSDLDFKAFAESVIRRFWTCYDCLWKVLRRYLNCELGLSDLPNSPKPILRLGNENNLFASSIEQWLRYAEARVGTSHDYDGEKAQACLELVPDFIDDAIGLYQTMTGETWD